MCDYEHEFWTEANEYHDFVRAYEQHVTVDHPNATTSCCRFCYHCQWHASTVTYPTYDGPAVSRL